MSIVELTQRCIPNQLQLPLELTPLPEASGRGGLWVDPVHFLEVISGWALAQWAIQLSARLQPWALPSPHSPGAPRTYRDESVLLTSFIAAAWRLSYERITEWLTRYEALAEALGYDQFDEAGQRCTISRAQYGRRLQALGLLPYFLCFVALVTALIRLGVIVGSDLIIDSTLLRAWYHHDPDAAWSWPSPWKGRVFGYKVHTIICRWSYLPLLFVVTPANAHDGPLAIPMFMTVVALYGLRILIVRADAAYFNYDFLGFVHDVLRASVNVDYNLRRKGKRFLATLFFIQQWRDVMGPRSNIERHYAFLKRYFGLKHVRVHTFIAVTRFVFQIHIAVLAVALIATRYQRPDLINSRLKVLAFVNSG